MTGPGDRLYELLPAVYRVRDAAQGQPLRALLGVAEAELQALDDDIAGLYENWFVETCEEWVVPYLADLLGVRGVSGSGVSQRAFVANTLRYRRGKGTIATLEQVARDVSGWPARAVEAFLLLTTTQHLNHVRPGTLATVDLRDRDTTDLVGGPFDRASHVADVRHVDVGRGIFDIPNVAVFVWRLQAYPAEGVPPAPAGPGQYRFHPLGRDTPMFTRPQTEQSSAQLASEANVPGPLRAGAVSLDLRTYRVRFGAVPADARPAASVYYGEGRSFSVERDGDPVLPIDILCADLGGWDRPPPGKVAVDVRRGRLAFAPGEDAADVRVSWAYGFAADLGGGPYDRRGDLAVPGPEGWTATVSGTQPSADFATLAAALDAWADPSRGNRGDGVITILDGDVYAEVLATTPGTGALVVQAADGARPLVRPLAGDGSVGEWTVSGGAGLGGTFLLEGLLVEGGIRVGPDSLAALTLRNCTVVPGRTLDPTGRPYEPDRPSLVGEAPNERLDVVVERSIVGPLRLPPDAAGLTVRDSIVDSPGARRVPVLVSGGLSPFPALSSVSPTVAVRIGAEGPHDAQLTAVPTTLAEARDLLQAAIRAASPTAAFAGASVRSRGRFLVVVPGSAEPVSVEASGSDPTAAELSLDAGTSRTAEAMLSGRLDPFPPVRSATPTLGVSARAEAPHTVALAAVPASMAQARDQLEATVRAAAADPALTEAMVVDLGDQLAVVPGTADASITFGPAAADPTTVVDLGLQPAVPAVASPAGGPRGDDVGPAATFERATVLGGVLVRQLTLASNVVFGAPVVAERRQVGCTRFTYVPEGSRVPRRHHCQPVAGADPVPVPQFTSTTYGDPGYCQLARSCPPALTTGADDEGEMGAFNLLHQAQRLESLRNGLDQYLPFGLEAGVFFVT